MIKLSTSVLNVGQSVISKHLEWSVSQKSRFLTGKITIYFKTEIKTVLPFWKAEIKLQLVPSRDKWQVTSCVGFSHQNYRCLVWWFCPQSPLSWVWGQHVGPPIGPNRSIRASTTRGKLILHLTSSPIKIGRIATMCLFFMFLELKVKTKHSLYLSSLVTVRHKEMPISIDYGSTCNYTHPAYRNFFASKT